MMNYNVTQSTPHEEPTSNFMDAGIQENVAITRIEYNKTEKSEFLAFYFENENGDKGSHTEWIPKADSVEELNEKTMNQISRIKQIARCFIPADQFVFQANTFEEFAKKVIAILLPKVTGIKLRVKFVYPKQSSRYTGLPTYWKYRFIERMDNNGYIGEASENSKIKIMSIDTIKRNSPEVSTTQNPFNTGYNNVNTTATTPF